MFRNLKNESIHIKSGEAIFYSTKLFRHLKKTFFFLVQETSLGDDIWPKLEAYVISGRQQVN